VPKWTHQSKMSNVWGSRISRGLGAPCLHQMHRAPPWMLMPSCSPCSLEKQRCQSSYRK
jgi:hypothetical protein